MDLDASRPWWPLGDMSQMRDALRHWIANNWATDITVAEWWERLASAGLAAPTWNRSHGGLAATALAQQVVEEELAAAGAIAPPLGGDGVRLVGPVLRQFGSAEQSSRYLPPLLTGRHLWSVLLNDVGAEQPADTACVAKFDWKYVVVNGSKTCNHDSATHAVLVARSSELPGRKGLSCFLVELDGEGIERCPGAVTFRDVALDPDQTIGPRDGGWSVVNAMLPYLERSLAGRVRRGLVNVEPGTVAGNLDRTVADVIASHQPPPAPDTDRRAR